MGGEHDVVASTLPQENEPRPEVKIAVRSESHLGKESILPLLVVRHVLQPLTLCNYILGAPRIETVGEEHLDDPVDGCLNL